MRSQAVLKMFQIGSSQIESFPMYVMDFDHVVNFLVKSVIVSGSGATRDALSGTPHKRYGRLSGLPNVWQTYTSAPLVVAKRLASTLP